MFWTHRHCGNLKLQLRKERNCLSFPSQGLRSRLKTFSVSQPPSLFLKSERDSIRNLALVEQRAVGLGDAGAFSLGREDHLHSPQDRWCPAADPSWGCLTEEGRPREGGINGEVLPTHMGKVIATHLNLNPLLWPLIYNWVSARVIVLNKRQHNCQPGALLNLRQPL